MDNSTDRFIAFVRSAKFRWFLLQKIPAAFFSGVKIKEITTEKCVVSVPFRWFTQNPFRSTYFACLAMAAEMSTGLLAMARVYKSKPPVSMLVVKLEAEYFKKAAGLTIFTCTGGALLSNAVETAISTGAGQTVATTSSGKNEAGELIARFTITWSFKAKAA